MKRFLSLLFVLCTLLSLAGCKTETPANTTGTGQSTESFAAEPNIQQTEPAPSETEPNTEATTPPETQPNGEQPCQHNYIEKAEKAATCTENGLVSYTCSLCGDRYEEAAPALGHNYIGTQCGRCGVKLPGQQEIPAGCDHQYVINTEKVATCTEQGVISYDCSKCHHRFQENIPASGHKYAAASCTKAKTCTVCGSTQGSPLGHSYAGGTCSRCGQKDPASGPITFTATIKTDEGGRVSGVTVTVYTDESGSSPAGSGITDANGVAAMTLPKKSTRYKVVLSNIPSGLSGKESYTFSSPKVSLTLKVDAVISPDDHSKAKYGIGDTMGDFTLTDTDGNTHQLSQLLKKKDLVVLNFWYVACTPCKNEFPHFDNLYQQYKDDMALLTMSPFDSEEAIRQLKEEMGLSFPMMQDTVKLSQGFNATTFPVTVFIGKDGKILTIQRGAYATEAELKAAIERFL